MFRLRLLAALFPSVFFGQTATPGAYYSNPVHIEIPAGGVVESCADPSIIRGADRYWYAYCTSDPLNGADRNASGAFNAHFIPVVKTLDLVNWTYSGDVFQRRPAWAASDAALWAPAIKFFGGTYYLYYAVTSTSLPGGGSAIGVATSANPGGPWTDSGAPAVEPHAAKCCPGTLRAAIDPEVIEADGRKYIYYGSYPGGISARTLSTDGLRSDPASETQIAIPNRYEAANIVRHGGYFYLFVSASNCCNGPLTGYSVFAGRSRSALGPFLDREGVSLLSGRVGGTPVIGLNGNRWVGPGHNAVFTDFAGQDWFLYHAIDRDRPYFDGATGFTRRPLMLDALDWVDGWPAVRAGLWASDTPQPPPAAHPGAASLYKPSRPAVEASAGLIATLSDEFDGQELSPQWTWVRRPPAGAFGLTGGVFRFDTQAGDLFVDTNNAPVLTEPVPDGDYVVETRVALNLPAEGCCYNFVQSGLVIYGDDDNYIKLVDVSIWETRQTEFAKELSPAPPGYPRYGSAVIGPPGEWTYLRIAKHAGAGLEQYTGLTSRDGECWTRGSTWTHSLAGRGPSNPARIGLVSMGGAGLSARFDYVRVYRLDASDSAAAFPSASLPNPVRSRFAGPPQCSQSSRRHFPAER